MNATTISRKIRDGHTQKLPDLFDTDHELILLVLALEHESSSSTEGHQSHTPTDTTTTVVCVLAKPHYYRSV